jgi:hypothetical protein
MTHSTLTFDTLQATYSEQIELFMVKLLDSSISDERAVLNDAIRHSLLSLQLRNYSYILINS